MSAAQFSPRPLTPDLSISTQLSAADIACAATLGFRAIINNRPDAEERGQPTSAELAAVAAEHGLDYAHLPVIPGKIASDAGPAFAALLHAHGKPALAFCRTGNRSTTLWALAQAGNGAPTAPSVSAIIEAAHSAGFNLATLHAKLEAQRAAAIAACDWSAPHPGRASATPTYDVVIVGGGAAGSAAAASLMRRRRGMKVAIIEPSQTHHYQPGWTLVGGGVFTTEQTRRPMQTAMPGGVTWIRSAVASFAPDDNQVELEDGSHVGYQVLIMAAGLTLDWGAIDGLAETLGSNGVTSNYRVDLAPYTWDLVQSLRGGTALFTQPGMPIKCAGAPQKAMYLSCDHWRRAGVLNDIEVEFNTAAGVLFGVKEFVPALMDYIRRYNAGLAFGSTLVAVRGKEKIAVFDVKGPDGVTTRVEKSFDMLHAVPPQVGPAVVAASSLADAQGWVSVDHATLRHTRHANVFGLGDGCSAPNAKTAAAVRKQAPIVAVNALATLDGAPLPAAYDGYGACPLTVERGRVVLAEFGYGGKLLPTFPMLDNTKASRIGWLLKARAMPPLYWQAMLRGREWLATPDHIKG
jgi:sulfide:quinone oxidoreductase